MRIDQALNVSNRTVSSRDAEVFLGEVTKKDRAWLYAHGETELTAGEEKKFEGFMKRREKNEPVAYITGHKEFYGYDFICDKRALIPRPETETLVDLVLKWMGKIDMAAVSEGLNILELGTGCGNIAIALAVELGKLKLPYSIIATDIEQDAIDLASENYEKITQSMKKEKRAEDKQIVQFIMADLFDNPTIQNGKPYDLIVANLPYVPDTWRGESWMQEDVKFFEPNVALFGGKDGLDIYRKFFSEAQGYMKEKSGKIIIEFNEDQGEKIAELAKKSIMGSQIKVHQDYAGLDRVLEISLG